MCTVKYVSFALLHLLYISFCNSLSLTNEKPTTYHRLEECTFSPEKDTGKHSHPNIRLTSTLLDRIYRAVTYSRGRRSVTSKGVGVSGKELAMTQVTTNNPLNQLPLCLYHDTVFPRVWNNTRLLCILVFPCMTQVALFNDFCKFQIIFPCNFQILLCPH